MTSAIGPSPGNRNEETAALILPTLRTGFQVGLFACGVAVAFLAFSPVDGPTLITAHDKINHLVAFAVLSWLADGAYPGREDTTAIWGLLLLYGMLIELIQHLVPYRDCSLLDFGADALGILVYIGAKKTVSSVAMAGEGRWRRDVP